METWHNSCLISPHGLEQQGFVCVLGKTGFSQLSSNFGISNVWCCSPDMARKGNDGLQVYFLSRCVNFPWNIFHFQYMYRVYPFSVICSYRLSVALTSPSSELCGLPLRKLWRGLYGCRMAGFPAAAFVRCFGHPTTGVPPSVQNVTGSR